MRARKTSTITTTTITLPTIRRRARRALSICAISDPIR